MLYVINRLKNKKSKNDLIRVNSIQSKVKNPKKKLRRNLSMSINLSQDCKNFGNSFLQPDYNIRKDYEIFNDITKVNLNQVLSGKRKMSDLSNLKSKKIQSSYSPNFDYYKVITYSFNKNSTSLNNSLCELKCMKKGLRYNNNSIIMKKKNIIPNEKKYKSVIEEKNEKNKNKAIDSYLNFKKTLILNKENKKNDFRFNSNKNKKKLNLSTINIIINNSNGFLDKLRRENCVEHLYPKNEIEKFSNGFLI